MPPSLLEPLADQVVERLVSLGQVKQLFYGGGGQPTVAYHEIGSPGPIRTGVAGSRADGQALLFAKDQDALLAAFQEFCRVDLNLGESTTEAHVEFIRQFLREVDQSLSQITSEVIRGYLARLKDLYQVKTYRNRLGSLKRFFRDFLGRPDLVGSFKFPRVELRPKHIPTKAQVQAFLHALKTLRGRTVFLMLASSGLRTCELLSLTLKDIDLSERRLTPVVHVGSNKRSWISFYNEETAAHFTQWLATTKPQDRVFPFSENAIHREWRKVSKAVGVKISPKVLRDWFCQELGERGVPDRYVDAFCGRTPKSVLARHYSDYAPERLKKIYGQAGLTVLS